MSTKVYIVWAANNMFIRDRRKWIDRVYATRKEAEKHQKYLLSLGTGHYGPGGTEYYVKEWDVQTSFDKTTVVDKTR